MDIINKLELKKYMLSKENIDKLCNSSKVNGEYITKNDTRNNKIYKTNNSINKIENKICYSSKVNGEYITKDEETHSVAPRVSSGASYEGNIRNNNIDSLFWCYYIIINGYEKYELLGNINIVIEKNIKINYIDKIRESKDKLKKSKIRNIIDIENDLVDNNKINMKTFISLCIISNISICIINKKIYYEMLNNEEEKKIHTIINKDGYYEYIGIEDNIELKEKLYKIDNYDMKLKNITHYTLKELIDISKKINIDLEGKKLKKDIYEILYKHI